MSYNIFEPRFSLLEVIIFTAIWMTILPVLFKIRIEDRKKKVSK